MFTAGMTLDDGTFVVTSEPFLWDIQRHSVEHCTCSWCHPHALSDWKKLPRPGRFGIEVPPKGNRWKWTHFTFRWGKWQYYYLLRDWQLFPSVEPFCKKERW